MEEDLLIEEELQEEETDEETQEEIISVSDGDSIDYMTFDAVALYDMQSDVQVIADSTIQGYLSSSIVSVFDRLVDKGEYRYYVAFRGVNEDSSAGILYLSNEYSDNQLYNCQVIKMYRVYTGQNYEYTYHYDVTYDDSEYFNFGNGALYYTNIETGYPALGSPKTDKILSWLPVLSVGIFLAAMLIRRKIREC